MVLEVYWRKEMKLFTDFNAITVGQTQMLVRTISEADVRNFVEMTGDDNPLHVDRKFAEMTTFKDIVVHGMLGASFISTIIGTKLPGPGALWVSQNMEFLLPVRLGDVLTVRATVLKKYERERLLELETLIFNQNQQVVLKGVGKVKLLVDTTTSSQPILNASARVAIVTGGAGGIGRAICQRLADNGYHVVINYLGQADRAKNIASEINSKGKTKALAVQADISTEFGAQVLYDASIKAFDCVSVLINNASPRIHPKSLQASSWSDVQKQIDVQVKGAFLMTRLVAPQMGVRKWGRIVNVTSQVLEGSPSVSWTGYAMAKGALHLFSKYMAAELGPLGITVNCVSPGMCETGLIGDIPEKTQLMVARQTPLRRLAQPQDVAAAVAYLVSEDANFVTGDTLAVNGGIVMR